MKSASQPSSEIRKAGSLTFAGIIFYCAHILQQAQARDAQVGVDVTSLDVTEVDSAESLSDQSSPMVAELKDSPLNDTETIATADLSVVQVADHDDDDDMTQGKDAVLADNSSGGISPIYLVGSTVLIGAGALLINSNDNDNDNGDDSSSTVSSSEPYDFDSHGVRPLEPNDGYSDDDFGVGVARPIGYMDDQVLEYEFWDNALGSTSQFEDRFEMTYWAKNEGGSVIQKTVTFDDIPSDSLLLSMKQHGVLEFDPDSSDSVAWLYIDEKGESASQSIFVKGKAVKSIETADDMDFIGNNDNSSFFWTYDEDGDHLDILSLNYEDAKIKVAMNNIDMTGVVDLTISDTPKGFKIIKMYEKGGDGYSSVETTRYWINLETGGVREKNSIEYKLDGSISDVYSAGPVTFAITEDLDVGVSTVFQFSQDDGVKELATLPGTGYRVLSQIDLNDDGINDCIICKNGGDGDGHGISSLGVLVSNSEGEYDLSSFALPDGLIDSIEMDSIYGDGGSLQGFGIFADSMFGSIQATMTEDSIQRFEGLADTLIQDYGASDLDGDGIVDLLEVIVASDFPTDVLSNVLLGVSLGDFEDAGALLGLDEPEILVLAFDLGIA